MGVERERSALRASVICYGQVSECVVKVMGAQALGMEQDRDR